MATVAVRANGTVTLLREDYAPGAQPHKVDRDKGIIFGVKVLGRTSPNRHGIDGAQSTEYTPEAMQRAVKLYEGLKVNVDHPPREKPGKDRSSFDRLGKLQNVRIEADGIYADLHLLKSHPMAERLMEAAEKMPDCFGLSHNAYGKGQVESGVYRIHEIVEVRSVDVVADAGTVQSLFESKTMTTRKTVKATLESAGPIVKRHLSHLLKLNLLREEDELPDMAEPAEDLPMDDAPVAGAVPTLDDVVAMVEQIKASHDPNIVKEEYLAGLDELLAKLKELGAGGSTAEADEGDDAEKEKDMKESKKATKPAAADVTALREQVDALAREKKYRKLCKDARVDPDDEILMESLLAAKDEAAAKRLIDREAKRVGTQTTKPRSLSPHNPSLTGGKPTGNYQSFLESIRN